MAIKKDTLDGLLAGRDPQAVFAGGRRISTPSQGGRCAGFEAARTPQSPDKATMAAKKITRSARICVTLTAAVLSPSIG